MRGILLGLCLAAALLGLLLVPQSASAQSWYGTATTCSVPYDYGVSGYYGSNCQNANAYAGWGYGAATANQYSVSRDFGYFPQWSGGAAYSPWGYGSYGVSYCRAWWGC